MGYSVLNNYNYTDKSFFINTLDFLSTPCRRVLGGKNVDCLSNTQDSEMLPLFKVITAIFSVIVFPIGIISVVALASKLITFPCLWESKRIKQQAEVTSKVSADFFSNFSQNKYDDAIKIVRLNPNLIENHEVSTAFFKIVNTKINNNAQLSEISHLIQYLSSGNAIELTNHSIRHRLTIETQNSSFCTGAEEFTSFILDCLRGKDLETVEQCFKRILTDALKINIPENPSLTSMKMYHADHLTKYLVSRKINAAKNELEISQANLLDMVLRMETFPINIHTIEWSQFYKDKERMNLIIPIFNKFISINRSVEQHSRLINKIQIDTEKSVLHEIMHNLKNLVDVLEGNERDFCKDVLCLCTSMDNLIHIFRTSSDHKEIEAYTKIVIDNNTKIRSSLEKLSNNDVKATKTIDSVIHRGIANLFEGMSNLKLVFLFESLQETLFNRLTEQALKRITELLPPVLTEEK